MNLFSKIVLLTGLIFSFSLLAFGQSEREKYEQQRKQINKDIAYKNKLLKEAKKSKKQSLSQLEIIRGKVANREQLIRTLRSEISLIDNEITASKNQIAVKEHELKLLKDEYAKMIYHAYKTRSNYDKFMFVFASESFNQAYKRLRYLQQYTSFRKKQAQLIVDAQSAINQTIAQLEQKKEEKKGLIANKETERKNLDSDRAEKQKSYNELHSKVKDLKKEIKKKQKKSNDLRKLINKLIAAEAKIVDGTLQLTPEALALSSNFTSNKGKLPWPTSKGVVTEYFGKHAHPDLPGIQIENNGVNISTEKGSTARAVFKGKVTQVLVIPGMGKGIMIRHGEYISVYTNLSDVFVQKGDEVDLKENIGTIMTDANKGVTEVHFQLWKKQTILNPANWLYKFK